MLLLLAHLSLFLGQESAVWLWGTSGLVIRPCVSPLDCAQPEDGDSRRYQIRSSLKAGAVFPLHGEPLIAGKAGSGRYP